jgi:RimJ/RimL family protein N-acetyltransferase
VARWLDDGEAEITYWIDPAHWGRGIATRAMRLFLDVLRDRPVRAHVAADNAASIAVLERLGFRRVGSELSYANARGTEIEEHLYRLD